MNQLMDTRQEKYLSWTINGIFLLIRASDYGRIIYVIVYAEPPRSGHTEKQQDRG